LIYSLKIFKKEREYVLEGRRRRRRKELM